MALTAGRVKRESKDFFFGFCGGGPIQTARLHRSVIGFCEGGPIQTARLRRSVIGTPEAKNF
jgi:hypothetical protein